jgi:hypothetical protein
MTFQVPTSAGDLPENRFEFSLPKSKKTYSVPKLEFLTGEQMMKVVSVDKASAAGTLGDSDIAVIFELFEDMCDAPVRALAMDQLFALYEAWSAASDVTPGESDGSPSSSASTD